MNSRILIVDDSLTVRMDLSEAFEAAGFRTTVCATLQEAREKLSATEFGLAVLDVLLPDGDGVEFLAEIKGAPQTANLPVMLLSTEAQVHDRIRGLKTGADEYVGKPYDCGYVAARARELMRVRRARTSDARPTVLVIDDSPTFRYLFEKMLRDTGYHVLTAASGEEGLHSAVNHRPAAILIDSRLPGIDGATVVRRIREDAALRRTPCLLLTASEDRAEEVRALEAGADGFVRKDEEFAVIAARLAAILRSASTPSALAAETSFLGPKKILAVDDSPTFLAEVSAQLRQEGYDVALAHSGEEALALMSVQAPDCILLDVLMPVLSGYEVCRRVKAQPALRDIPLLMLTGVDGAQATVEGINAGADDFIPKSGDFEVVRARVRAALRRKQFEDENRSVREQLLRKEMEAAEARSQRELAETRAALLDKLRASEERIQIAAEAANLGAWYWNVDADEYEWGDRLKTLLGLPAEAQPSYELLMSCIHPEDRERIAQQLRGALERSGECDFEYRAVWPDGTVHWIVAKGRVLAGESGRPTRMTGVAMDVTERKRTEEALVRSEKLASVGRMAATMAHEINNPLEAVVNALFLVSADGSLSDQTRAHLELAERELDRVAHMARQTLGFYRENTLPSEVQLPQLVDDLLGLYSRKLSHKRIAVERNYRVDGPIKGIAGELRQIVSNLIANSIDALPANGTIHIRIADTNVKDYGVRLTVADNGSGISRAHLQAIFEPFFTTKKELGTGLGLWVTRQIVEKHGGSIRVRSQAGEGTVFSVFLPREPKIAESARRAQAGQIG